MRPEEYNLLRFTRMLFVLYVCLALVSPRSLIGKEGTENTPPDPGVVGLVPATSRKSLKDKQARKHMFADPDYFHWGGSVIRDENGIFHMFYARWPRNNPRGMYGWLYVSEIAHAVATSPEGPYKHLDVVLKGFGKPQPARWDASNAHNPHITKMNDPVSGKHRYYLYFVSTRDDDNMQSDWMDNIINQRVGVAVANSLQGPWKRHDTPIVTLPNATLHHYLVNPGVCQLPDGRFLMVLKGRGIGKSRRNPGAYLQGWALAHRPEGPFIVQENLLIPSSLSAEDPYVWVHEGWILAAVKDWHGKIAGTTGISFVRGKMQTDNTVLWTVPKCPGVARREVKWDDGSSTKLHSLERPCILLDEKGRATHLFAAASANNPFANADRTREVRKGPGADLATLPFNLCLPLVPRNDVPKAANMSIE